MKGWSKAVANGGLHIYNQMSTMIEKVAKAIALSVEEAQLEFWEEFIDQAKAAIAAMREPPCLKLSTSRTGEWPPKP